MSTFNKVILVGHLGNEPAIRTTDQQVKVADLSLATNEVFQKNGEKKEITDWHDVVAWRKLADFSERFLKKGSKIMVEGRLKTRSWVDKETGNKRKAVYVLADQIQFMDKKEAPVLDPKDPLYGRESFTLAGDSEEEEELPF